MAKAISINVGINKVTSDVFEAPPLNCCENDAQAMFDIACGPNGAGFQSGWISPVSGQGEPMLGKVATFVAVDNAIRKAAEDLDQGGVFLFTFAGHGETKILEPGEAEPDGTNEYIVLTDHLMLDTHWHHELWPLFNQKNARVIVIADCCHAAGVVSIFDFPGLAHMMATLKQFMAQAVESLGFGGSGPTMVSAEPARVRRINDEELKKELDRFKPFYDKQRATSAPAESLVLSLVLLSACGAKEDALEGENFGAFTQALLAVWNNNQFQGDYQKFIADIKSSISNTDQTPALIREGQLDFTSQRPFEI